MGGVGVTQCVATDLFAKVQLVGDLLDRSLNGGDAHRGLGRRSGLLFATASRKDNVGVGLGSGMYRSLAPLP